ncbi:MAG: kelch repeat-containing protein, partial [bacterium]
RYSHSMVAYAEKLFVFGGVVNFKYKRGLLNDIKQFDLKT